jgi:hypothetical protein
MSDVIGTFTVSDNDGNNYRYQTELDRDTGSTVTYDITDSSKKIPVLRNDAQTINNEKIYIDQFVGDPDTQGSPGGIFLSEKVSPQSNQVRTDWYNDNGKQLGASLGIPGIKNTAQEVEDSVNDSTPITPDMVEIGASTGRTDFGEYFYPTDLKSNKQDRIKFTLKEIIGSTITPTLEKGSKIIKREESIKNVKGSVTLPIQSGITDNNSVDWSGSSLNAYDAFVTSSSLSLMDSPNPTDLGENLSSILGNVSKKFRDDKSYGQALKIYLAQNAAGINGLLSRVSGAVLNPNLELLFNGPQLRPFNFTFRLSPRDSIEATEVRKIIRFFKEAMSVRTSSDNVFLKSPFVFDIKYITYDTNGKESTDPHPSINRIKTCALLSCDVDYTPDGSYMTFNDSARTMTSYGLSLRFSEIDPIYNTDYTDTANTSINIPTDHIGY